MKTSRHQAEPDVIPIQIAGGVDTDMSKLMASELMTWGLSNLWKEGREGGYLVLHGRQPVIDFGCPCAADKSGTEKHLNFFVRVFPGLFPYGEGGIEGEQEVAVDFSEHIQWALHYHDCWFQIEFKSPVHRTAKRLETGPDWTGCNWTAVASCLLFGIMKKTGCNRLQPHYVSNIYMV